MSKHYKTPAPSGGCATCGTNKTCQNCGGTGHWHTKPEVPCGHCSGSGACPNN